MHHFLMPYFAFHGLSTVVAGFHFPDRLHLEGLTKANCSHDTSDF